MSFNIGLSGLRAATKDLNVTGNNIANAGTAGFKQSRAEFSDVYAASVLGTGKNPQGSGVLLSNISQLFNQGNVNYTQNALDLAINGNGFFQVSNNGALSYTRAGYFGTDRNGFIVDNFGYNLQGYTVDANGNLQTGVVGNLQIQTASQQPKATTQVAQLFNLNSTNTVPVTTPFNAGDPTTYNSSTSTNIYDSQGNAHVLTQYFVKTGANSWDMQVLIDGRSPGDAAQEPPVPAVIPLQFTPAGQLDTAALNATPLPAGFTVDEGVIRYSDWQPAGLDTSGATPVWGANGATSPSPFALDLRGSTQFASSFAVNSVSQDGYTTGQLAGIEIDDTGVIFARYTNGQSKVQGQVILANFANVQGLTPVGKTQWVQSFESGEPVRNPPRSGTLGAIQAGALEDSNVELSDQLVNLIVAQRNYQANAKTIETESAITQTIINLR
ncbi:Flagellar hook protein FlgE [Pseudomonas oleovorans subsp. oleovorans]|jgi:flagellar hook protein FlgE|uniref:Flagellar hook protein FlgE n=1 Tax=Ectopseudomonas oleovorans TaxID=301 RepID=A0A379JWV2_ECTOL|nr:MULTISPECIES: flagellar hook protein FlgE [Pseudomonas]OWK48062.1 Flagellar hook protein FlgE [Pseudomonas oleovorans subsp. oleovorans]SEJ23666.1 flagellar hook protein FlgE [Pseudomonas oleovorans]SUD52836.1 flagellar hook protein FlgE [Pseudomonas oleovorans]SUD60823.1 flagellar hook protein FlgE [Pseudomonas oleovorans]